MAAVLGVSCHYHDAAAAIVVDGEIGAAIQLERLSRRKGDASFPAAAIDACLETVGIDAESLDAVVFYEHPYAKLERVLVELLRGAPRTFRQFPRALASQLGDKIWIIDRLAAHCRVPRARVSYRRHHESHAASAFFTSPFEHAAVLTVDGVGERTTTGIFEGRGDALTCRATIPYPHSLGLFYAAMTAWCGFRVNEGEYKVMGLAAFGAPRFREDLEGVVVPGGDDGSYSLALDYFAHHADVALPFSKKLERLLGPRRDPTRPWDLGRDEDRRYADVAASVQATLEDALLALARQAKALTGADALCLAGGVALNAAANGRLMRDAGFSRIYVQPAAGDAGGALGAAILCAMDAGDPRPRALTSAALGLPLDVGRGLEVARSLGLSTTRVDAPGEEIARALRGGKLVAHCAGRFEWGPRALGQRSLLAEASSTSTRDRINRRVKHREPFRPFAPAAATSALGLFEDADNDMTPFMTCVCRVVENQREALGSVTHVDGTARVQHVSGGPLVPILEAVGREGERAVVLNTSLNGPGEPIVATSEDALAFFLSHAVDVLYLDDVRIERP